MPVPKRKLKMCVVNPLLIDGLGQLIGSQLEVMTRLGISWNTWIKIRSGQPVKLSLGRRLRSRVVADRKAREVIRRRSPRLRELDAEGLERIFLLPSLEAMPSPRTEHEFPAHSVFMGGMRIPEPTSGSELDR